MIDNNLCTMLIVLFLFKHQLKLLVVPLVSYSSIVFWIVGLMKFHLCTLLVRLPRLWNL